MGLLNVKCRDRLTNELKSKLPTLIVKNDWFLEPISRLLLVLLDETLPKTGKQREAIESYIDHFPFSTYVADQLQIKLREEREYKSGDESSTISELFSEAEIDELSELLVANFDRLPEKYKVIVPMPKHLASNFNLFPKGLLVNESLLISPATAYFIESVPRNSSNERRQKRLRANDSPFHFLLQKEREWEHDKIYLQIETFGYIDQYGSTAPARQVLDTMRSFFGLAVACKIIHRSPRFERKKEKITATFHSVDDQKTLEIRGEYSLPEAFSDTLNDFEHIEFKPEYDNSEFIENYVGSRLKLIGYAFRKGQMNERILTASRWFFEAFSRQDEALQFVQLVIVLEVLVGDRADSSELGLGALYKNRVAYMLAKSSEERSEIMTKIGRIYSMRSKIVHNGKHSFSPSERVMMGELRDMLGYLFIHELRLLKTP